MASKSSKAAAARDDGEWSERIETVKEGLVELDEDVRQTVREHPALCLCGALAVGYLVGRLVARA